MRPFNKVREGISEENPRPAEPFVKERWELGLAEKVLERFPGPLGQDDCKRNCNGRKRGYGSRRVSRDCWKRCYNNGERRREERSDIIKTPKATPPPRSIEVCPR